MSIVARRVSDAQRLKIGSKCAKGGESSNTPPSNSKPVSWGGEDTARVGVGVLWGREFEDLCKRIEGAKKAAQDENRKSYLEWGGLSFLVRPKGFSAGGGKGSYHPYVLEHSGFAFSFVHRSSPAGETPNVTVEMGSLVLTVQGGLGQCWKGAVEIIQQLGGRILWDKLSRADLCVDLAGVDIDVFNKLEVEHSFVTRATHVADYKDIRKKGDSKATGVVFGKKTIQCRIYDKLLDVKKVPDKLAAMVQFRWGSKPTRAVRVEFELHREALKDFQCGSVAEYEDKRAALVRYLCSDWLRFTEDFVDRTHTTRAGVHPVWKQVQQAFAGWTGCAAGSVRRVRRVAGSTSALVRQGVGCLLSAIAQESEGEIYDDVNFLNAAMGHVQTWMLANAVGDAMADRIIRRQAVMPTWGLIASGEGRA